MRTKSSLFLAAVCLLAIVIAAVPSSHGDNTSPQRSIRIGTYDPRAIAIAYAHSKYCQQVLAEHHRAYEAAKAAKDADAQKKEEDWGRSQQIRLHLQGFAGAPVDDLIKYVHKDVAKIAKDTDVDAITDTVDYASPDVQQVDITDKLIALYHPSPQTLKMIANLRKIRPYPMEQIAQMSPEQ
jgi:hypothetical protein